VVNLVGGLYPGLYDWGVEVERPALTPGVCLTSEIDVRCLVAAEALACAEMVTSGCLLVYQAVAGPVDATARAMTCRVDVLDRVAGALECQARVGGDISVRGLDQPSGILPPVCAEALDVRVLVTAAIDCTWAQVVADIEARTKVVADEHLGCCCLEASHE
jgi:hypothetical protein